MEIKTRLDVGDKIYFIRNGRIDTAKIDMVEIKVRRSLTEIYYFWEEYDGLNERHEWRNLSEKVAFPTKEALIEHMLNNFKEE